MMNNVSNIWFKHAFLTVALGGVTLALSGAQTADEAARLFDALELEPGMTVGEVGAGRGEMTLEMANRLGPEGHVYTNELDPARLEDIRNAVRQEQLENVTVIESGANSTNLPEGCCDAIFVRDVYHHLTSPDEIIQSIVTALKPGGRFGVIDFEPRGGMRPVEGVPANREEHGIRPDLIVEEVRAAGMTPTQPSADWAARARGNTRMFVVVFTKPVG